jgi:hypothetical protein
MSYNINVNKKIRPIHLSKKIILEDFLEEVYDIFRNVFHNEEDALAATIQLFRGDPISWDEDYE